MSPIVVAISGGTCSGKSTFSKLVENKLIESGVPTIVLAMDQYMDKNKGTVIGPFDGKTYPEHNHPSVIDFDKLYAEIEENKKQKSVIIVEGLFSLFDPKIRNMAGMKIFVDLLPDERAYRRIKRGIEVWKQDFETVSERYLATVRHRHNELVEPTRWYADVVINGNNMSDVAISSIASSIEKLLRLA